MEIISARPVILGKNANGQPFYSTPHNYELNVKQWNETRRATLSFSYNFGKSKVAAARNRTSSAEEERARAVN